LPGDPAAGGIDQPLPVRHLESRRSLPASSQKTSGRGPSRSTLAADTVLALLEPLQRGEVSVEPDATRVVMVSAVLLHPCDT
jgi:hypothetical protein